MTQSVESTVSSERDPAAALKRSIPRMLLVLVGAAAGWIALQGAKEIQSLLAPTLLALTLVITVYPLVTWLRRLGVPGWAAALVALATLYATLSALVASLAYSVTQLALQIPEYEDEMFELWATVQKQAVKQFGQEFVTANLSSGWNLVNPERLVSLGTGLLSGLTGTLSLLGLILTVLMFLIMDTINMPKRMAELRRAKPSLAQGFAEFADGVRRYWLVTTIFGLIVAVLDYIALVIIGVPLALTWGVFSFVTNYIPNIGLIIGLVPPAALALMDGGVTDMVWVIVAYLVLNFVVQTIIQPKFTGDAVGITATVSFLSLLFWAYVLGPVGALLAVPMTLMVKKLLIDIDPAARWMNVFLASDLSAHPTQAVPSRAGSGAAVESGAGASPVVRRDETTEERKRDDAPVAEAVDVDRDTSPPRDADSEDGGSGSGSGGGWLDGGDGGE